VKRAALIALLALALLPAGAAAVKQRTSMEAILPQVMCVTCGIALQVAESPQADAERSYIQQLIDRGDTAAQVKRALIAQYGPTVLALPRASGFNLAVYIVPVVVVLALLALLAVLLPRWRANQKHASPAGAPVPTPLSPEDASRLEEELARYEPSRAPPRSRSRSR
jgi:cytochrome c-type biogenesis protein CcmH/NrfF